MDALKTLLTRTYLFSPESVSSGNDLSLLVEGPQIFARVLESIHKARHRIAIQIYQFASDAIGHKICRSLIEARRRGCEVKLIYDAIGSVFTAPGFFNELVEVGAKVQVYHSFMKLGLDWRWTKRNHRKMFLVDAEQVIIGGFNIADSYQRSVAEGGYHDVAVEVRGPACQEAWAYFDQVWQYLDQKLEKTSFRERRQKRRAYFGKHSAQIVGNDHFLDRWRIRREILYTFAQARTAIIIMNPYFVPDPAIVMALINAVKRGVSVSVIVPNQTDVTLVDLASTVVQHRLVKHGVEVYRWPGFSHGKAIVVDGLWMSVGSYNMDYRSLFHNLEIVVQAVDASCAGDLEQLLREEMRRSTKVTSGDRRKMYRLARVLSRILYHLRGFL